MMVTTTGMMVPTHAPEKPKSTVTTVTAAVGTTNGDHNVHDGDHNRLGQAEVNGDNGEHGNDDHNGGNQGKELPTVCRPGLPKRHGGGG